MQRDADLAPLHSDRRWVGLVVRTLSNAPREPALRDELRAMMSRDQAARTAWISDPRSEDALRRMAEIDGQNLPRLRDIVARHGWPGNRSIGRVGAHAAWLLVQHADSQPGFQRGCLMLLAFAVARGDARGAHYAYLHDRVAVIVGGAQRYGT